MISPRGVNSGAFAALIREPIDCALQPAQVLAALAEEPMPFALAGKWAGGGAIVGSRPLATAGPEDDPFAVLDDLPAVPDAGAAPEGAVGGGWFGWLGYRLARRVERVPEGPFRPVPMPEFHLAYYDNVLRRDPLGQWFFEALVTSERDGALRERRRRLEELLAGTSPRQPAAGSPWPAPAPSPLRLSAEAAAHHLNAVAACRRRIAAGEIFQANLCVRLDGAYEGSAAQLLAAAHARGVTPAYAASFDTPQGGIASLSPELFLRSHDREIVTGPIKGTTPRDEDPAVAAEQLASLHASAKDAAEHVMIVDLMRNDLGRVCEYGSVVAPRLPTAEAHPGLWHLVSYVRGRLRAGTGDGAILRATFPPGSVTGAPKVQALQVIAESELTGREVYTGAIGHAGPIAGLELNVAIRTLEMRDGHLWLGAGGGIVADSDPRHELEEALAKARPIAAAVGSSVIADAPARNAAAVG